VLNVLAELTYFADRGFYADWWNSVSWDQFARDWNRPVHNFLRKPCSHSVLLFFLWELRVVELDASYTTLSWELGTSALELSPNVQENYMLIRCQYDTSIILVSPR
jgi:MBOAT, membrane-bound O-acyltransferase family